MFYVFGISFIYTFSVFLFLYFTYSYTYHVFIFHACHMSFQCSYSFSGYISCLLSCSGYMPMLYYSFLKYCFIIYFLIRSCIVILYFPIFSSCTFHILISCTIHFSYHIPCAFIYFLYFSCVHILIFISIYTVLLVLITVYFHRITRLCFSYHIISYTFHIHFLCVYFSFSFIFMPANTLEVNLGNNWVYPKVLSLYETVIFVYVYPKVLSLYETVISVYCGDPFGATVIQTGSMSSTQTGPRYMSMYMLQHCIFHIGMHIYLSTRF